MTDAWLDEWLDEPVDLGSAPRSLGSAQCPRCGRFSRIVRREQLSIEGERYVLVDCAVHGRGEAA